ncbi:MAG: DUF4126 domain-containing protein [Pseudomonadota bacterium]
MDEYQSLIQVIALTMGVAWATGINLYATVASLGIAATAGYIDLPPTLEMVQDPMVIMAAGFMYCVEFFADKTPGVDTGWDALHTFIRIPAGAMLAAGAVGDVSPALSIAAGLVGGGVSATTHALKAGSRVMINTSPEPFSNWGASLLEDLAVFAGLWAALQHPVLFVLLFIAFLAAAIWLLPKLLRGLRSLGHKVGGWVRRDQHRHDKQLKDLADAGVITPGEYEVARTRIV